MREVTRIYLCLDLHSAAYDEAGRPCQYADCLSVDPMRTPLYSTPLDQNIPGNKIKPCVWSVQGDYDGSGQQSCKCNYVDFSK